MIDVLYIVGTGSKFGNKELLYSLRSLDKYGKNIDRLIISGECPDFIDKDKIVYVKSEDISTPSVNHWHKVRCAFKETDSKKVLLMYDDIFFCKETDLENYPYYYRGDLPEQDRIAKWGHIQYKARQWLEAHKYPTKHYGIHLPMIYERGKFMQLTSVFESMAKTGGVSVRSIYGNVYVTGATNRDDVKLFTDFCQFDVWLRDKECFSTAPENFGKGPLKWLTTEFPNKSRWEK